MNYSVLAMLVQDLLIGNIGNEMKKNKQTKSLLRNRIGRLFVKIVWWLEIDWKFERDFNRFKICTKKIY